MSTRSIHINGTTNRESELSIDSSTSAPQGYEKGDFDGYAVQVTINDGRLTIQPGSGAVNAKICYVEIGAQGTTIDQATKDRLAALIEQATTQTAATVQSTTAKRQYVFGSYVDELLSYTVGSSRYFVHSNHLFSPSAVTNAAGQVQERYRYDAYEKQTITTATGTTRNQSAVGFSRGFTGYIFDEETGLYYARARYMSPILGRFVSRDPRKEAQDSESSQSGPTPLDGYQDGFSLYRAYFIPQSNDPTGMEDCPYVVATGGANASIAAVYGAGAGAGIAVAVNDRGSCTGFFISGGPAVGGGGFAGAGMTTGWTFGPCCPEDFPLFSPYLEAEANVGAGVALGVQGTVDLVPNPGITAGGGLVGAVVGLVLSAQLGTIIWVYCEDDCCEND